MKTAAALWLLLTVACSIVTMWNPEQWTISVPEIAVFSLAGFFLAAGALGVRRLTISPVLAILAAIALWGILQLAVGDSISGWRTKVTVVYWAANAAAFFSALQILDDRRLRRWFLGALVVFGFLIALVGEGQSINPNTRIFLLFDPIPGKIPQFGPFPYRNQYAAFVELLLPVAIFRAMTEEKLGLFHGLIVAVLYTSVIASSSRMGFAMVTSELVIVPLLIIWRRGLDTAHLRDMALSFAVTLAVMGMAAGPSVLASRLESRDPYAGRRDFTAASFEMVKDRPLLGFGLGTWSTVYPGYAKSDDGLLVNQAHNDWAQWTAEGGIPFVALILTVAIWSARRALRSPWGFGVAAVFVHCLVDYPIQRIGVALVMFIMLAALAADQERAGPARKRLTAPAESE